MLVPSINYGAFVDGKEEIHKYEKIEEEMLIFCKELFYDLP